MKNTVISKRILAAVLSFFCISSCVFAAGSTHHSKTKRHNAVITKIKGASTTSAAEKNSKRGSTKDFKKNHRKGKKKRWWKLEAISKADDEVYANSEKKVEKKTKTGKLEEISKLSSLNSTAKAQRAQRLHRLKKVKRARKVNNQKVHLM